MLRAMVNQNKGLCGATAIVVLALNLLVMALPVAAGAQKLALSEGEVLQMLKSGESSKQIEALARDYGISFEITEETARELRRAGASEDLIKVLRELAPKPPAPPAPVVPAPEPPKPPVLFIESAPGGAQVYVDDEPVGKTSAEGRLKLTQLSPAEHRVRISHEGQRDHEQKLLLAAGETVRLVIRLEPLPVAPPVQPVPGPGSVTPGGTARRGASVAFLGLKAGPAEANGLGGVPIVEVQAGSAADRVGLRAGYRLLAVDGQSVSSPQDVVQAIRARRPGENAEIVFDNGTALSKVVVQLGGVPSEVLEPPAPTPAPDLPHFTVAHNHSSAMSWCYGVMTVGDGKIVYRSTNRDHSFSFPLSDVREVRKNPRYISSMKGFHIRMTDGSNYNFALLRNGKWTEPYELFEAIERVRGTGEGPGPAPREERGFGRKMKKK